MKKFVLIFFIISIIFFNGCADISKFKVDSLQVKSAEGNIKSWIEKNSEINGVYLVMNNKDDKSDIIYIYQL